MTSQLAKEDLDDLRAEGLTPTDEDIIRLHALAARISDGPETTAYNAPRFAIAGGVVFWEPTLAAYFWYNLAKTWADDAATENFLFAFACAHGREGKYLDTLHDPEAIQLALGVFISSLTCTATELERAISYVVLGLDHVEAEKTGIAKKRDAESRATDREFESLKYLEAVMTEAAAATGMSYADIMQQTPSRLCSMIVAANIKAGMTMTRTSATAHASYLATLGAIAKRLREEKLAKEEAKKQ